MPSLIALDDTLGASFLGLILSAIIYGVTCLQVYSYFVDGCLEDSKALKVFVAVLMMIDSLHLALVTHTLYWYLITNFGDYIQLEIVIWSLDVEVAVAYLLTALVQGFFAWRIFTLSSRRNWWIPALIIMFSLVMFGSAIAFVVMGIRGKYFSVTSTNKPATVVGLTAELASDFFIMGGMFYYLNGGRTDFESTNKVLNKLIAYTINSGALTTVFTVFTLAIFLTGPDKLVYTPFFFVLVRLYSCTFMSILNSRRSIRAQIMAPSGGTSTEPAVSHELDFVTSATRRSANSLVASRMSRHREDVSCHESDSRLGAAAHKWKDGANIGGIV